MLFTITALQQLNEWNARKSLPRGFSTVCLPSAPVLLTRGFLFVSPWKALIWLFISVLCPLRSKGISMLDCGLSFLCIWPSGIYTNKKKEERPSKKQLYLPEWYVNLSSLNNNEAETSTNAPFHQLSSWALFRNNYNQWLPLLTSQKLLPSTLECFQTAADTTYPKHTLKWASLHWTIKPN